MPVRERLHYRYNIPVFLYNFLFIVYERQTCGKILFRKESFLFICVNSFLADGWAFVADGICGQSCRTLEKHEKSRRRGACAECSFFAQAREVNRHQVCCRDVVTHFTRTGASSTFFIGSAKGVSPRWDSSALGSAHVWRGALASPPGELMNLCAAACSVLDTFTSRCKKTVPFRRKDYDRRTPQGFD